MVASSLRTVGLREDGSLQVVPGRLPALDDRGQPRYSGAVAEEAVAAGMPVAAPSPLELARWICEQIRMTQPRHCPRSQGTSSTVPLVGRPA
jgi:hypothetical protein